MKNKADELFKNVKTLPSLPPVVQKIFSSINDPRVGARQLAEIITTDQTLTLRVLKLVNSSFFGLRGKVQNIHHAVTMLGFSTIRQICLGVSICNKFKNLKTTSELTGSSFWAHSVASATLAKKICKTATKLEPDACYTLGLVHDIGKLLLMEHHMNMFVQTVNKAGRESIPLQESEQQVFDLDHADVGSWLMRKWNLPRDARRSVKNHHSANMNAISPISPDAMTGVIYFANQLAHHFGLGGSGNPATALEEDKFRKFFGKNVDEMDIDKVSLHEEVHVSLEILGVADNVPSAV